MAASSCRAREGLGLGVGEALMFPIVNMGAEADVCKA